MNDKFVKISQDQLAVNMGLTPEQMKAFSNLINSDAFQKQSAQRVQEQILQQLSPAPTPMPEVIPYAKLQLEEQQELKKLVENYQEESLRALQSIEQNTANLYTIVDLISKSNEQQEELIAIITEVLSIAKAKTKEEAESTYRKVMEKITKTVEDAETLGKISGFATTVWQLAQPIIEKLPLDTLPL